MDKMDRRAMVLALVDALRESGSWCGETHIQKSCYALQTLFEWPTDFDFTLYKHGPFSFDLEDYVGELWSDNLLAAVPTDFSLGTGLTVTEPGKEIGNLRKDLVQRYSKELKLVSEQLGRKHVCELEKIATAIYVTQELGTTVSVEERARRITHYKKHVSEGEAEAAVLEADALRAVL